MIEVMQIIAALAYRGSPTPLLLTHRFIFFFACGLGRRDPELN